MLKSKNEVHLLMAPHHKYRWRMDRATWKNAQVNFLNPIPTGHSWYATQPWPEQSCPSQTPLDQNDPLPRSQWPDITEPFQRCPSYGPLHRSWMHERDQSRWFWCSCRSVYILLQHLAHHIRHSLSSFWYLKGTSTMLWRCPGTYPCYRNTSQVFLNYY